MIAKPTSLPPRNYSTSAEYRNPNQVNHRWTLMDTDFNAKTQRSRAATKPRDRANRRDAKSAEIRNPALFSAFFAALRLTSHTEILLRMRDSYR